METKDIIKKLRKENNITQSQLGVILNCDRTRIADIERGRSNPTLEDIKILKEYFNVSADYLLGLSDAATNDKDLQFICDYTGLSANAVKVLLMYTNYTDNEFSKILSQLIEGAEESPYDHFLEIVGEFPEQRVIDLSKEEEEFQKKTRNDLLKDIVKFVNYEIDKERFFSVDYWGNIEKDETPFSELRKIISNKEIFDMIMLQRITEKLKHLQEDYIERKKGVNNGDC